jgi:hypothetical protein
MHKGVPMTPVKPPRRSWRRPVGARVPGAGRGDGRGPWHRGRRCGAGPSRAERPGGSCPRRVSGPSRSGWSGPSDWRKPTSTGRSSTPGSRVGVGVLHGSSARIGGSPAPARHRRRGVRRWRRCCRRPESAQRDRGPRAHAGHRGEGLGQWVLGQQGVELAGDGHPLVQHRERLSGDTADDPERVQVQRWRLGTGPLVLSRPSAGRGEQVKVSEAGRGMCQRLACWGRNFRVAALAQRPQPDPTAAAGLDQRNSPTLSR